MSDSAEVMERVFLTRQLCNLLGDIVDSLSISDIDFILTNANEFSVGIREFIERGDDI